MIALCPSKNPRWTSCYCSTSIYKSTQIVFWETSSLQKRTRKTIWHSESCFENKKQAQKTCSREHVFEKTCSCSTFFQKTCCTSTFFVKHVFLYLPNIGKNIEICFSLILWFKIWYFWKQFLSSIRDWEVIFFYKCKSKVGSRKCMSWAFQILSYFYMLKSIWPHNLWLKIRTGFLTQDFDPQKQPNAKMYIFSKNKVRHNF